MTRLLWSKMPMFSGVEPASYIVFTDGRWYYAKNGFTGMIEYSDTNASKTIQYAINKLGSSNGGTIYVKKGTYPLSSRINITYDNIRLVGEGGRGWYNIAGSTVFVSPVGDYAVYIKARGVSVESITINGNNQGNGIFVSDAFGLMFDRVRIENCNVGLMSAPDRYNSDILVLHPFIYSCRRGIVLDANLSAPNPLRSELWTIIGGAIYGNRDAYIDVGIELIRFDFISIIGTLVAYANLAYRVASADGNGWVTMFSPKVDSVTNGMLIEDGNVDVYGLDFVAVSGYRVRVYANATNKVSIRSRGPISIEIARDATNTSFGVVYTKELVHMTTTIRTVENASIIRSGPILSPDLYIQAYTSYTGERLHLQTLAPDGAVYDRLTVTSYENPARVAVKNAVLNIQKDLQHSRPVDGDIYIDSANSKLCVYLGGVWKCTPLT